LPLGAACDGAEALTQWLCAELVLSVIMPLFEFEACPQEIDWRMGITVVPYVKGKESKGPSVPMTLRKL
jgi:hypothetical protein